MRATNTCTAQNAFGELGDVAAGQEDTRSTRGGAVGRGCLAVLRAVLGVRCASVGASRQHVRQIHSERDLVTRKRVGACVRIVPGVHPRVQRFGTLSTRQGY